MKLFPLIFLLACVAFAQDFDCDVCLSNDGFCYGNKCNCKVGFMGVNCETAGVQENDAFILSEEGCEASGFFTLMDSEVCEAALVALQLGNERLGGIVFTSNRVPGCVRYTSTGENLFNGIEYGEGAENVYDHICLKTDSCSTNPCQNGGKCINLEDTYRCECNEDFTGDNCETSTVSECYLSGTIYAGPLLPATQWIDSDDIEDCEQLCAQEASCVGFSFADSRGQDPFVAPENVGKRLCNLYSEITAANPSTYTSGVKDSNGSFDCSAVCTSSTCQNGGTCTNLDSGYTCECTEHFAGLNCEKPNLDYMQCENDSYAMSFLDENQEYYLKCNCQAPWSGEYCENNAPEESELFIRTSGPCEDEGFHMITDEDVCLAAGLQLGLTEHNNLDNVDNIQRVGGCVFYWQNKGFIFNTAFDGEGAESVYDHVCLKAPTHDICGCVQSHGLCDETCTALLQLPQDDQCFNTAAQYLCGGLIDFSTLYKDYCGEEYCPQGEQPLILGPKCWDDHDCPMDLTCYDKTPGKRRCASACRDHWECNNSGNCSERRILCDQDSDCCEGLFCARKAADQRKKCFPKQQSFYGNF